MFVHEFKVFLERTAPEILDVVEAISNTANFKEASRTLGISSYYMQKHRQRLEALKNRFLAASKPRSTALIV